MELYSPREIALAAGVPTAQVLAALDGRDGFVGHADAVRIGRRLINARKPPFALFVSPMDHSRRLSLALTSAIHVCLAAAVVILVVSVPPPAAALAANDQVVEPLRMVFLTTPGPGGGGGGGGLRQKAAPPKALRQGQSRVSSPLPVREPPKAPQPAIAPPEPVPPPLNAEALPVVVAPIIRAPADDRDRTGVLQQARSDAESRGSGQRGGTGSGAGTGLGEGDGSGVGPGSGGGTGGGPFRPGSGVVSPRLLKEVKGDYTDQARRAGISGDVVLEIIVRRDGSVGDVRILQGLGGGLNERAIQAVRQWKFAPATRQGVPVDVVVEVAMEFKLR